MISTKEKARAAVKRALNAGKLMRPATCSRCGLMPALGSDGRATIHAHHHRGYDRPLDVEWLCVKCHFKEDRRPRGEANGNAKLSANQVVEIRRRYRADATWWNPEGGAKPLAREFGVSDRTIRHIVLGENWINTALKAQSPETAGE